MAGGVFSVESTASTLFSTGSVLDNVMALATESDASGTEFGSTCTSATSAVASADWNGSA